MPVGQGAYTVFGQHAGEQRFALIRVVEAGTQLQGQCSEGVEGFQAAVRQVKHHGARVGILNNALVVWVGGDQGQVFHGDHERAMQGSRLQRGMPTECQRVKAVGAGRRGRVVLR